MCMPRAPLRQASIRIPYGRGGLSLFADEVFGRLA